MELAEDFAQVRVPRSQYKIWGRSRAWRRGTLTYAHSRSSCSEGGQRLRCSSQKAVFSTMRGSADSMSTSRSNPCFAHTPRMMLLCHVIAQHEGTCHATPAFDRPL